MPAYLIYFHPLQLEVGSANGVHRAIMADSVTSNDPCIRKMCLVSILIRNLTLVVIDIYKIDWMNVHSNWNCVHTCIYKILNKLLEWVPPSLVPYTSATHLWPSRLCCDINIYINACTWGLIIGGHVSS